jgi:hypothetical protein
MLGVILLILKIILWSLLVAFAVVFILINIILWVPIRYRIYGSKYESILAYGRITYLLRLLRVKIRFDDDGLAYQVKVLFWTISEVGKRESKGNETKKKKPDLPEVKTVTQGKKKDFDESTSSSDSNIQKTVSPKADQVSHTSSIKVDKAKEGPALSTETTKPEIKATIKPEIKATIEENGNGKSPNKKVGKVGKVKKVKKVKKAKKVKKEGPSNFDQAKEMISFLRADENQGLLKFVIKKVFKIIKLILPRKIKGDVMFGLSDPATTGYVLGMICIFYPVYHKSVSVAPNFEMAMIEGDGEFSGKITIGVILYYGIRIVIDRRVRRLIKKVRK